VVRKLRKEDSFCSISRLSVRSGSRSAMTRQRRTTEVASGVRSLRQRDAAWAIPEENVALQPQHRCEDAETRRVGLLGADVHEHDAHHVIGGVRAVVLAVEPHGLP
jgi:hypothetical protein